ncbi:SUMO1 sentrin specific peptidase 8 [Homalodisca vitripennis]|nr:SUMO1 sentrin specific peptidase 8 [Homalodisca vitripennis]
MENLKYQSGDLVIAKLKGHAAWPAVVENVEKKGNSFIFSVMFYGSKDKGICRLSELSSYVEQKHKISQEKKMKNGIYALALKEIEADWKIKQKKQLNRCSLNNSTVSPLRENTLDLPLTQPTPRETRISNLFTAKNKTAKYQDVKTQTLYSVQNMETNTSNKLSICMSIIESKYITDDSIDVYYNMLTSKVVKQEILLMNPVITQAVKCLNDTDIFVEPLQIRNRSFIFFPISDSPVNDEVGGSHWSLLMYEREHNGFFYFDSIGDYNFPHAEQFVKNISKHLGLEETTPIHKVAVPQQNNGVDCGIYMLIFGDILIQLINQGRIHEIKNNEGDFWPDIKAGDIITKRAQLAFLLHNNNFIALRSDTVAEMMYQVPTPTPNLAPSEYPASASSIVDASANHIADSNLNVNNQNCKCNMKQNIKGRRNEDGKEIMDVEFYSDSHGRGLPELIGALSKGRIRVSGLVMPGATTQKVYRQAERALHRPLVIIAGTNNVLKKSTKEIYLNLEKNLQCLSKERTVYITTIPNRYDTNPTDRIHHEIDIANNYIREVAVRMKKISIIDLEDLKRHHFTRHGLHLNYQGKKKLSYMIINSLSKTSVYENETFLPVDHNNITQELQNVKDNTEILVNGDIKIIESNMRKIINKNKNNEHLAFAHCISRDFSHKRHMSAGVATVFCKQFGKPTTLLTNYLTHQKSIDGVNVYGLITKSDFYKKPIVSDYDTAFKHFTEDFKIKNLKYLICSPMGCVRDNISTEHFAANIVDFQQHTGASVQIIIFNENSNLHTAISAHLLKQMETNPNLEMAEAVQPTSLHSANGDRNGADANTGLVTPQECDISLVTTSLNEFPPLPTTTRTVSDSNYSFNSCKISNISCSKVDENVGILKQNRNVRPDALPLNSPITRIQSPT